MSLQLIKRFQV